MAGASAGIPIVIVDDHPAVREALKVTFDGEADLHFCGECACISDALAVVRTHPKCVVVVDVTLGDENGLDLVKMLRDEYPQVRAVVFSMHRERILAERANRAGALAYVAKSASTAHLLAAIRHAARGERYTASPVRERRA